ncbi:DDE 3 domain-containing protein [Aphis craccivora]|uniref:DDE 3 domain-containing protein n=1 Tax=Aphis craccivora TaxID=307492 RepID=A0A6G0YUF5_APHCR|nr:DDE 3 domain-containing protein [Aphis craccivora]
MSEREVSNVAITPLKANPRGKLVGSRQKLMIINLYKTKMLQQPKLTIKEVVKIISKELGIGQRTAQLTIAEYKNEKTVRSPEKTKIRATFKEKIDDFERDAIRRKVHEFWFRKQLPTLDKILIAVNEDPDLNTYKRSTLHLIVRDLNFVYVKRGRNSALIEREDIVLWRTKYIEDIRKYRSQGRTIYYLDETWVNAGDCNERIWQDNTVTSHREAFVCGLSIGAPNPTAKGKRLIVVHIGSEEGFVDGGLLVFESKKGSADYHEEMNGDVFFDWLKGVIPLLKDNSVISLLLGVPPKTHSIQGRFNKIPGVVPEIVITYTVHIRQTS